jgi:ribosomal protein L22
MEEIVRVGFERGRRRGRGRGRGRGWNHRILEVGVVLSEEEVSQRVLRRGRQGGGS